MEMTMKAASHSLNSPVNNTMPMYMNTTVSVTHEKLANALWDVTFEGFDKLCLSTANQPSHDATRENGHTKRVAGAATVPAVVRHDDTTEEQRHDARQFHRLSNRVRCVGEQEHGCDLLLRVLPDVAMEHDLRKHSQQRRVGLNSLHPNMHAKPVSYRGNSQADQHAHDDGTNGNAEEFCNIGPHTVTQPHKHTHT